MRLFVGLEIPSQVRIAMEEQVGRLKHSLPHASWVSSADYHLLLAFLGDREEASLGTLGEALSSAFASRERFEIQLAGAGSSPPMRPARVLWVGVDCGPCLEGLHRAVWAGLTQVVDIEAEWRPFHAHLTAARCPKAWTRRCAEVWCRSCSERIGEPFEVRQGALFLCEPGGERSRYQVIRTFPLKELH